MIRQQMNHRLMSHRNLGVGVSSSTIIICVTTRVAHGIHFYPTQKKLLNTYATHTLIISIE